MYNCILHNKACDVNDINDFVDGMNNLLVIKEKASGGDEFYKDRNFWYINVTSSFFSSCGEYKNAIIKFVESCKETINIFDDTSANCVFPNDSNCFLGIDFSNIIGVSNRITCLQDFLIYKEEDLLNVNCKSFWEKRSELFDKLIFCENVKSQIESSTDKNFKQVINKLKIFNKAIKETWVNGGFSYKKIMRDYPLDISPESEGTIVKYGDKRTFQLPDGRNQLFDLHIKMGDIRIHFLPDCNIRKVYVGYIGKHLPIISEN